MCQDDDTVTGITPGSAADVARQNELHDLLDSEWDALQQHIAQVNPSVGEVKKLLMESDGFAARTTMEARVAADGVCSWYTSPPAKRPRGRPRK